ncbi:hypothetical protein CVT26_003717 [Gymnopilus dilepis]|uniref:Uncharacterized protein n=1 Tax=Gymnopilus dilepis TaxID=231916 RepID=A0A409YXG7_9AGAR|nr:hypothetical protein CVT26_003717 [Gymnopilus dilepis]
MQDKLPPPLSPSSAMPAAPPAVTDPFDAMPAASANPNASAQTPMASAPSSRLGVPPERRSRPDGDQLVPDTFKGIPHSRNWSAEAPPHPSLLFNPGGAFFAVIIVGQPVGLMHDLHLFLHLLQYQSELWFVICECFGKAVGAYKLHLSRGHVRIAPHLNTPLLSIPRRAKLSKNIVNWSNEAVLHYNAFDDPGYGSAFYGTIFVGQPVGIVHDLEFFLDLLIIQSEVWYVVSKDFTEAFGAYKTAFNMNQVRITPRLTVDLPSFGYRPIPISLPRTKVLPRHRHLIPHIVVGPREKTPEAQEEDCQIDPTLVEASTSPNVNIRPDPESPIEISTDESESGSDNEEKLRAPPTNVVDKDDDPRLAHLPRYPRAVSAPPRTLGGPPTLPASIHPDFNPFKEEGISFSGVAVLTINPKKRSEPPSEAEHVSDRLNPDAEMASQASARKRRQENVRFAFEQRNKVSSSSTLSPAASITKSVRLSPSPAIPSPVASASRVKVPEDDQDEFIELPTPSPPKAKKQRKRKGKECDA